MPVDDFHFANNCPANPVAQIFVRRWTIHLLLGEKAGMREDVAPRHSRDSSRQKRKSEIQRPYENRA